ncbi:DUF4282 domain-containing protein [Austwickia chelonae]|uniref:DUF4282 domain-containing protein n=1 Tax=Austwickia chelonae TaxID=100225 RepID=UPI0013C31E28|nr:DUF4282 domain-containing protein [Austwickia chelonae]
MSHQPPQGSNEQAQGGSYAPPPLPGHQQTPGTPLMPPYAQQQTAGASATPGAHPGNTQNAGHVQGQPQAWTGYQQHNAGYPQTGGYPHQQQYGQGPGPNPMYPGQMPQQHTKKGLLGSLFDLSFQHFATPHIVRIVYILLMSLVLVFTLLALLSSFVLMANKQAGLGIVILLVAPFIGLIQLAMARMTLEVYIAMCRTAEETSRLREELSRR